MQKKNNSMGRPKKYKTEEERKAAKKEYNKRYMRQYNKTPIGRAHNLLTAYKQSDKIADRGECTLTAQWIIDNIFTQKCAHCPETDWHKLGCNRIDNALPHTPDNVEPCCEVCNNKQPRKKID